jgi:hypothetical protein
MADFLLSGEGVRSRWSAKKRTARLPEPLADGGRGTEDDLFTWVFDKLFFNAPVFPRGCVKSNVSERECLRGESGTEPGAVVHLEVAPVVGALVEAEESPRVSPSSLVTCLDSASRVPFGSLRPACARSFPVMGSQGVDCSFEVGSMSW